MLLSNEILNVYMSPELLSLITNKNDNINDLDLLKTNIYSLGIIII